MADSVMKWYVVRAIGGQENKVKSYIECESLFKEDEDYYHSASDALEEVNHLKFLQPENIYVVEEVLNDDIPEGVNIIGENDQHVSLRINDIPDHLRDQLIIITSQVALYFDSNKDAFESIRDITSKYLGYENG